MLKNKLGFVFFVTLCLNVGSAWAIEATEIEVDGTKYKGVLSSKEEIDYFRFTLPADGNVIVTFSHKEISDSYVYWQVNLYGETDFNNSLGAMSIKGIEGTVSFFAGITAGTYFIKIEPGERALGYSWWNDQYYLSVNFEQSNYYEKSPNHKISQATSVDLNAEYSGNLSSVEDIDYFAFNLLSDGNVILIFRHEEVGDIYDYWNINLYGESDFNTPLGAMSVQGTEGNVSFSTGIGAGTYFIKIEPSERALGYSWWNDQYYLSVNFEQSNYYEKSPNHKITQATPIDLNTEYSGNLFSKEDIDYFTFSLPIDGDVVMIFRHQEVSESYSYWNVNLYKENKTETTLATLSVKGNKLVSTSPSVPLMAGVYFVKIEPSERTLGYSWWNDQYFLKIETDVIVPDCIQAITYAKNPTSSNWFAFPTSCEVPEGWITQMTRPEPCPLCPADPEPCPACPEVEPCPTCSEVEDNSALPAPPAATLTPELKLHIPVVDYGGLLFWADLESVPNAEGELLFKVTNYGEN
jgi:hypothetical protein